VAPNGYLASLRNACGILHVRVVGGCMRLHCTIKLVDSGITGVSFITETSDEPSENSDLGSRRV
jgi:hypothetical protein